MILKVNLSNQHWKKYQKQHKSKENYISFFTNWFFVRRLQKLHKPKEEEIDFRAHLKQSTNKFALKDEHKDEDKVNFREQIQLKSTKGEHHHEVE